MNYTQNEIKLFEELEKLKNGNQESYESMYKLSVDYIYKLITDVVGYGEAANAILNDVYTSIYYGIGELKDTKQFYSWGGFIATSAVLNYLKNNGMFSLQELMLEPDEDVTDIATMDSSLKVSESFLMDIEKQRIIGEYINMLSYTQKIIVQYYYYEDKDIKVIADSLGISEKEVKKQLTLIRRNLMDYVGTDTNKTEKLYDYSVLPFMWVMYKSGFTSISVLDICKVMGIGIGEAVAMAGAAAGSTGMAAAGSTGMAAAGSTGMAAAGSTGMAATVSTGMAAAGSTGMAAAGSTGMAAAGSTGMAAAGSTAVTSAAAAGGAAVTTTAVSAGVGIGAKIAIGVAICAAVGAGAAVANHAINGNGKGTEVATSTDVSEKDEKTTEDMASSETTEKTTETSTEKTTEMTTENTTEMTTEESTEATTEETNEVEGVYTFYFERDVVPQDYSVDKLTVDGKGYSKFAVSAVADNSSFVEKTLDLRTEDALQEWNIDMYSYVTRADSKYFSVRYERSFLDGSYYEGYNYDVETGDRLMPSDLGISEETFNELVKTELVTIYINSKGLFYDAEDLESKIDSCAETRTAEAIAQLYHGAGREEASTNYGYTFNDYVCWYMNSEGIVIDWSGQEQSAEPSSHMTVTIGYDKLDNNSLYIDQNTVTLQARYINSLYVDLDDDGENEEITFCERTVNENYGVQFGQMDGIYINGQKVTEASIEFPNGIYSYTVDKEGNKYLIYNAIYVAGDAVSTIVWVYKDGAFVEVNSRIELVDLYITSACEGRLCGCKDGNIIFYRLTPEGVTPILND